MSLLTPLTTATTAQYKTLPVFMAYQYKDDIFTNKVYWDDSTAYPITLVNATKTLETASKFSGGVIPYSPQLGLADQPYVGVKKAYHTITATVNNGTATIENNINWDMTYNNYAVFVLRSTGTATTGDVIVRSTTGNEVVQSFTMSAVAGTYNRVFVDLTDTGLYVGSPNLSAITEVEISIDTLGQDVEIAMTYGVNEKEQAIGALIPLVLQCPTSLEESNEIDFEDQICRNQIIDKIETGRTYEITAVVKKRSLQHGALATGTVVEDGPVDGVEIVNSSAVGGLVISSDTLTIGTGLVITHILVPLGREKITLYPNPEDSASNLPDNMFHYNSSTGVVTFGGDYNNRVPEIYAIATSVQSNYTVKGLRSGYYGAMYISKTTRDGRVITMGFGNVKLLNAMDSASDDGDELEMTFAILPDSSEIYSTVSING